MARQKANTVEGMFPEFSMAVIDTLLSFQSKNKVEGNILEFGVYKGRSAAILGPHLAATERLVLVDIEDYLDPKAIQGFLKATDFILTPTENFRSAYKSYSKSLRTFRFIHIDASHAYRATFNEMKMADELLSDKGIIALDDFTNLNYAQNIAAIFKYLMIFLVTDQKAYLCRKADLGFFLEFILDNFIPEMRSREIEDCCLARTDLDTEFSAYYARTRLPGEEGHFYGVDIYLNYINVPI